MLRALVYRLDDSAPSQHRVINLSAQGARLGGAGQFEVRSMVIVSMGQVEHVAADVVWVQGDFAGLNFHAPIDVARARLRPRDVVMPPPTGGWLGELRDRYRG